MIDELLDESGLLLSDLDALAFGRGPGAFTGVRIAAGITQGLAYGANLPVIPISTLAALAQGSKKSTQYILSAIDARMGEIYWAIFKVDSDGLVSGVSKELVSNPKDIVIPTNGEFVGRGNGWLTYHETLTSKLGSQLIEFDGDTYPQSQDILSLAMRELERGNTVKAEDALPVYLRNKVTG